MVFAKKEVVVRARRMFHQLVVAASNPTRNKRIRNPQHQRRISTIAAPQSPQLLRPGGLVQCREKAQDSPAFGSDHAPASRFDPCSNGLENALAVRCGTKAAASKNMAEIEHAE